MLGRASSNEDRTFKVSGLPAGEVVIQVFIASGPEDDVYIDEQRVPLKPGAVTEIHINM